MLKHTGSEYRNQRIREERQLAEARLSHVEEIQLKRLISVEMDGKNAVAFLMAFPKWSYADLENAVRNEGGSIDGNGIIHRPPEDKDEIQSTVCVDEDQRDPEDQCNKHTAGDLYGKRWARIFW